MSLEELFAGRNIDVQSAKARMADLMAAEGLPYGERTMTYNSRLAQELGKWADDQKGGEEIHNALFRAYFVDNVNLARVEHLVSIAASIGLDHDEATRVLTERQQQPNVDADWQRSRQLLITGVPTFVVADRKLVGAQPYDQLEALVAQAGAPRRGA